MRHEVLVYNKTGRKVPKEFISNVILRALDFIKSKQPVELAVLIVSQAEIKRLNKTWRNKDYMPDELSFGLSSRETGEPAYRQAGLAKEQNKVLELGEIVVNVGKISDENNLAEILIHSLLHLLGYNHEKSKIESLKVERLETKIFKHLKIF